MKSTISKLKITEIKKITRRFLGNFEESSGVLILWIPIHLKIIILFNCISTLGFLYNMNGNLYMTVLSVPSILIIRYYDNLLL